jgi:hypothetical protein
MPAKQIVAEITSRKANRVRDKLHEDGRQSLFEVYRYGRRSRIFISGAQIQGSTVAVAYILFPNSKEQDASQRQYSSVFVSGTE